MSNIIFIFGEDTFRSLEYLKAVKRKYITKALGNTNLTTLAASQIKRLSELAQAFTAAPFLAPKRLVIVSDLIKENKQLASQAADLLGNVPAENVVIFFERGKPDRRNRLVKELAKRAVVKEFQPLAPYLLKDWVRKKLSEGRKTIEPAALERLIKYTGANSGAISQEIAKLRLVKDRLITTSKIKQLVSPFFSDRVYQLTDLFLSQPRPANLLRQLDRLRLGGEKEIMIFFALVNFNRSLILASRHPGWNIRQLMGELGLNYYLARRLVEVELPGTDRLISFYRRLLDYDLAIKTGKIEIGLALDLIVCQWAKLMQQGAGHASNFS